MEKDEKKPEIHALEMIREGFKMALTDKMLKDSSKMPSYEDGFYNGVEYLSMVIYKYATGEMCSTAENASAITSSLITGEALATIHALTEAYHLASHLYASGTPTCSGIREEQAKLDRSLKIGRAVINNMRDDVLSSRGEAPKKWTN